MNGECMHLSILSRSRFRPLLVWYGRTHSLVHIVVTAVVLVLTAVCVVFVCVCITPMRAAVQRKGELRRELNAFSTKRNDQCIHAAHQRSTGYDATLVTLD